MSQETLPLDGERTRKIYERLDDAMHHSIVSVKDLIPGIRTDGLRLAGTDERLFCDFDEQSRDSSISTALNAPFANYIYFGGELSPESKKDVQAKLQSVFENQIVVDLGAGAWLPGFPIADRAHAKGYVAVEPNFKYDFLERLGILKHPELLGEFRDEIMQRKNITRLDHELGGTPAAVVAEDMLVFLKRLPDSSVSLLSSGIDKNVIDDDPYRAQVAQEIIRVLNPDGAYIGYPDENHITLPKALGIEEEFIGENNSADTHAKVGSIDIYRKIKVTR